MSWFVENPWPLNGIGALALVLLGVAFYQTRRGILLGGMLGVVLMVLLCWVAEWLVVTQREEVEFTLQEIAAALESNDVERVIRHVDEQATDVRAQARSYLSMIEVTRASVSSLSVVILRGAQPTRAEARFLATLEYKPRSPSQISLDRPVMPPLEVQFVKRGDRWLVTGFKQATRRAQTQPGG